MDKQNLIELFGVDTKSATALWSETVSRQFCPYIGKKCVKVRKSEPSVSIGTCTVRYGKSCENVIICPHRLTENNQIFFDCIHLLTLHEPGNELHILPEVAIPGGSVDFVLTSVKSGKVKDFVGVELQTLDTTGSVWGHRQSFLESMGVELAGYEADTVFSMNWKMTAKTILMQLHHKIRTFEDHGKHLVLATQNCLMDYMKREFSFEHVSSTPKLGDSLHFHGYDLLEDVARYRLVLSQRASTDADGIAKCLGQNAKPDMELDVLLRTLENKISTKTLLIWH